MTILRTFAVIVIACGLLGVSTVAQDNVSLGDLARQERERKAASKKSARVIESLEQKAECGGDWDCFIAQLEKREPARMSFADTVDVGDVYGVVITSEVRLETGSLGEDTVILTGRTENTTAKLTGQERQRLLNSGFTKDGVDRREQQAQEAVKRQDAQTLTCTFQIRALKEFLESRKGGDFSDDDWKKADHCDGLDQTVTNPFASQPSH